MSGIENQRQRIATFRASDIENALREACQVTDFETHEPSTSRSEYHGGSFESFEVRRESTSVEVLRSNGLQRPSQDAQREIDRGLHGPLDARPDLAGLRGSSFDVHREHDRRSAFQRPMCERDAVALVMPAARTLGRFRALIVPRALVGSGNLIGSRMVIIPRAVVLPRALVALPALAVRALVVPRSPTRDLAIDDPDFAIGKIK